jgi:hypothetical protein
MKTWQLIISILLFQVTWFSAAFGFEVVSVIGIIFLFACLIFSPVNRLSIVIGIGVAVSLGVLMDAFLYALDIYSFPSSKNPFYLCLPTWLLTMWLAFSTTLFSSFYWALSKYALFIALCAILGPFSYLAGREIGIIQFENNSLFIMVFSWGLWASVFLVFWHRCIKKISI